MKLIYAVNLHDSLQPKCSSTGAHAHKQTDISDWGCVGMARLHVCARAQTHTHAHTHTHTHTPHSCHPSPPLPPLPNTSSHIHTHARTHKHTHTLAIHPPHHTPSHTHTHTHNHVHIYDPLLDISFTLSERYDTTKLPSTPSSIYITGSRQKLMNRLIFFFSVGTYQWDKQHRGLILHSPCRLKAVWRSQSFHRNQFNSDRINAGQRQAACQQGIQLTPLCAKPYLAGSWSGKQQKGQKNGKFKRKGQKDRSKVIWRHTPVQGQAYWSSKNLIFDTKKSNFIFR